MTEAIRALRAGRVVAAATESTFGLLADVTNPRAIQLLFELKPRTVDRGVPVLVPGEAVWLGVVASVPDVARRLASAFWPGPLTIALPARPGLPLGVTAQGTVAVRCPGRSPSADLVAELGRPVTATSANAPGQPPAVSSSGVRDAFWRAVSNGDLVVVDGAAPGGPPSTLVRIEAERVVVIREGAVSRAELARVTPVESSSPPGA